MAKQSRARDGDTAAASRATKMQRTTADAPAKAAPSQGESATQVFTVELLTQKILSCLDSPSVVAFATFLRSRDAWRHVLSDEKLWSDLVTMHFGAHVPVAVAVPPQPPLDEYSDDDDEEDEDDDDGEEDDDGGAALADGVNTNDASDDQSSPAHDSNAPTPPAVAALQLPVPAFACQSLVHFARSTKQRARFDDAVHVIQGDIGTIMQINGHAIDGIAFATSGYLHNPHMGAAQVVFTRAGRDLDAHVSEIAVQIDAGEVHVTPGFDAGVQKLIHCAGPTYWGGRGIPLLAQTYNNVMLTAVRENLDCVAMTSISTGNLGFPVREAASTGLRAIQRFIREQSWDGTIGIVCYEVPVFDAFTQEKQVILDAFNTV